MNRCAKCGACTTVCPVFQVTGKEPHAARGKIHLLERMASSSGSKHFADIFSSCLLCGACLQACPRQVDTPKQVLKARQQIPRSSDEHSFLKFVVRKTFSQPGLLTGLTKVGKVADQALENILPADSGLRLRLDFFRQDRQELATREKYIDIASRTERQAGGISFFAGCYTNYLQPQIGIAIENLLAIAGEGLPHVPTTQACCGLAVQSGGGIIEAKELAQKNIKAFEGSGQILTSCASCYGHLRKYPDLFNDDWEWREKAEAFAARVCEFSTYFAQSSAIMDTLQNLHVGQNGQSVFYHDPCHLRFETAITAAPRHLLSRLGGITLVELPGGPQCCGMGGLFHLAHQNLSQRIRKGLINSLSPFSPTTIVTTCSGCLLQLRQGSSSQGLNAEVKHLAVFFAELLK